MPIILLESTPAPQCRAGDTTVNYVTLCRFTDN